METTNPNFTNPAKKVNDSRRFGFLLERIIRNAAKSELHSARTGLTDVIVSISYLESKSCFLPNGRPDRTHETNRKSADFTTMEQCRSLCRTYGVNVSLSSKNFVPENKPSLSWHEIGFIEIDVRALSARKQAIY